MDSSSKSRSSSNSSKSSVLFWSISSPEASSSGTGSPNTSLSN
ncbi:Uncharacterised protein [Vibrio cholerae]|nr:Uncharacterised protein [Vibrio cholerae]